MAIGSVLFVFVGGASGVTAKDPGPPADDDEPSMTGQTLQRASSAALDRTGGGEVTRTEVGDEESYYEVEVVLPDGQHVDVQLDHSFTVVSTGQDRDDAPGG